MNFLDSAFRSGSVATSLAAMDMLIQEASARGAKQEKVDLGGTDGPQSSAFKAKILGGRGRM